MDPLVSIIVPCFNDEASIEEALSSALNQTYPNKEVVVVDDGSTDRSTDIVRSFGSRLRLVSQENKGAPAARNHGLRLAEGDFIQFLDADDVLYPKKISRQMQVLSEAGTAVVYCDYNIMLDGGKEVVHAQLSPLEEDDAVCLALTRPIQTSSPIHHREWLERVGGFSEDLPCSQEFDLHLRMAGEGMQFYHLPEILFEIRKHDGSISADYVRVLEQFEGILFRSYKLLEQKGELSELRRRAFAEAMCSAAAHLVRQGAVDLAKRYYSLAGEMHGGAGLTQYRTFIRWMHYLLGPVHARRWLNVVKGSIS